MVHSELQLNYSDCQMLNTRWTILLLEICNSQLLGWIVEFYSNPWPIWYLLKNNTQIIGIIKIWCFTLNLLKSINGVPWGDHIHRTCKFLCSQCVNSKNIIFCTICLQPFFSLSVKTKKNPTTCDQRSPDFLTIFIQKHLEFFLTDA